MSDEDIDAMAAGAERLPTGDAKAFRQWWKNTEWREADTGIRRLVAKDAFAEGARFGRGESAELLAVVKALAYWDRGQEDERISEEGAMDGLYEICERARAALKALAR